MEAHRVNKQLHTVLGHHGVVFVSYLIEGEAVLEAGATAAADEYAQLQVGIAFLFDQLFNFIGRIVGKQQRILHFGHCIHDRSPC